MAQTKPRNGRDDEWTTYSFTFDEVTQQELKTILGAESNSKLIDDVAVVTGVFVALRGIDANNPKPKDLTATLNNIESQAQILLESINSLSEDNCGLLGQHLFIESGYGIKDLYLQELKQHLECLAMGAASLSTEIIVAPGRPKNNHRRFLASQIAHVLENHKITPTKYREGPYIKCLEVVLQATDEAHDPDVFRLASQVLDVCRDTERGFG